ncbi:MAG: choice-of-anchor X domain-containing protein [Myxococcota bacterium]
MSRSSLAPSSVLASTVFASTVFAATLFASALLGACADDDPASRGAALSQWCLDPVPANAQAPAGSDALMTLVGEPGLDALAVSVNGTLLEYRDDGTAGDAEAGDGIYSRFVAMADADGNEVEQGPDAHVCDPVVAQTSGALGVAEGALKVSVTYGTGVFSVTLSCETVTCPANCSTLLGGSCAVCFYCEGGISFH